MANELGGENYKLIAGKARLGKYRGWGKNSTAAKQKNVSHSRRTVQTVRERWHLAGTKVAGTVVNRQPPGSQQRGW